MALPCSALTSGVREYVFPGFNAGKPLSGMAMEMLLRRMKTTEVTVHGFRSSFRDWCGDKTNFPREVAEAALAHKVGDQVERAYRRSDALDKEAQAYGGMGGLLQFRQGRRCHSDGARETSAMTRPKRKSVGSPPLGSPLARAVEMFSDEVKEDLHRLATRLGFEPFADPIATWAVVGWVLAQDQPEFKKRARGRPSLKDKQSTRLDYQRYLYLWKRCRELGEELGKTITHEAAIERAMDEEAPLFSRYLDALKASVSRGRSIFEKARRELRRNWAAAFRRECEGFRNGGHGLKALGLTSPV